MKGALPAQLPRQRPLLRPPPDGRGTAPGWLQFGQVRDGWAVAGMGVIAACGAAGAWLNVRAAAKPADPVVVDTMAD